MLFSSVLKHVFAYYITNKVSIRCQFCAKLPKAGKEDPSPNFCPAAGPIPPPTTTDATTPASTTTIVTAATTTTADTTTTTAPPLFAKSGKAKSAKSKTLKDPMAKVAKSTDDAKAKKVSKSSKGGSKSAKAKSSKGGKMFKSNTGSMRV